MYSLCGSEPTALEVVCCEWRNALLVVQARNDDDGVDCIGSTFLEDCHACCQEFVKFSLEL